MSDLTYAEIGETFVRALCAQHALGHVSCAGLSDYVKHFTPETEATKVIVMAFAAARLDHRAKPAQAFIADWLATSPLAAESAARGAMLAATLD